jgi:hypothetical protein
LYQRRETCRDKNLKHVNNAIDACFCITPAALLVVQYNENFLAWKLIGKKKM